MATVRGIGVAVMTSMCGAQLAAGAQRVALLHTEPVLLVDDDEAEIGEPDPVLDERVGADDDAGLAATACRVGQRACALRAQRAGEQRDLRGLLGGAQLTGLPDRAEHRAQRAGVLRGQHLGGREQRRLLAGVDDLEHRPQRDDRLARADIALHEPVHRVFEGEIGGDLLADLLLPLGEHERQLGLERGGEPVGARRAGGRRALRGGLAAQRERELHTHRLVPHQAGAGGVVVGLRLGHVDAAQRPTELGQPLPAAQALRQRIGRIVDHVEHLPHAPRDLQRADLRRGRVHGDERADLVLLLERLELRVRELQGAVEHADLAGEHRAQPRLHDVADLLPVEERAVERGALLVADHHVEQGAATLPHRPLRRLLHLRDDGDVLADLETGDVGEPATVDVAARVVAQQITDGAELQLGLEHVGGLAPEQRLQRRLEIDVIELRHYSTPSTNGKSVCPPRWTTTSTSGWVRRRSSARPSPSDSSASAPSSAVTISPPAVSMR